MKFVYACAMASMAGYTANASSNCLLASLGAPDLCVIVDTFSSGLLKEQAFFKEMLLNMQKDSANKNTDCMKGYDQFLTLWNELIVYVENDSEYYKGLSEKGQATGNDVGFAMQKFEKYVDITTSATSVFNECDIDYYMQALSKAISNVAGFSNQLVNTYWRSLETGPLAEMETELNKFTSGSGTMDTAKMAQLFGGFIQDSLMAEIPDTSSAGYYQDVGQLM